jgi:molybdenum cofactor synthesis domain-containing protein
LLKQQEKTMCNEHECGTSGLGAKTIPVEDAIGSVLAHDVTEIRKDEFKGRAFRKGHVIRVEDVPHLKRLGKEHIFVLHVDDDEMHEDAAAVALAQALMGDGVALQGEPKEGKVNLVADRDGLLKVDSDALLELNMLGEVLCSTLHTNTVVKKGRIIAATKAVPLVVKRAIIDEAVAIAQKSRDTGLSVVSVKEMRKPKVGVVITGREVYEGRVKDSFAPMIAKKIEQFGGEIVGTYFAPDDKDFIRKRLEELVASGADLLIATGGMSVDPDDVTRFAIRDLSATDIVYGSPVLPGAMMLVGYLEINKEPHAEPIPILGIPACGMFHKTTVIDLLLPRILVGEKIGRKELAELGHGGMCLNCTECRYPVCPFGK